MALNKNQNENDFSKTIQEQPLIETEKFFAFDELDKIEVLPEATIENIKKIWSSVVQIHNIKTKTTRLDFEEAAQYEDVEENLRDQGKTIAQLKLNSISNNNNNNSSNNNNNNNNPDTISSSQGNSYREYTSVDIRCMCKKLKINLCFCS